jgi:multicomponent Na+:H+ antiporter subunit C
MILVYALVIAIIFGAGAYLLLKHDLIRVTVGMELNSTAANLFIMASGLSEGIVPILPIGDEETVSDPLVQAMVLTAIVISFGVTALLLSLVYRVYTSHLSLDIEELSEAEEREEAAEEFGALVGRRARLVSTAEVGEDDEVVPTERRTNDE